MDRPVPRRPRRDPQPALTEPYRRPRRPGVRLLPELADVVEPWDMAQEEAPLLLWTPSAAYLYSAESERIFQVPAGASADVDRLLVHGSAEAAQSGDLDRLARIRDHFDAVGVPVCG